MSTQSAVVTAGKRVLFVEDDVVLREIAGDVLTQAGYHVEPCSNGREALLALTRGTFDMVLSDVRMPDMDGLSLLKAVRETDSDLPVVLCTGGPSLETAVQAVEHGALRYLIKPVPTQKLLDAVERAVKIGALARLKREALAAIARTSDKADLRARLDAAIKGLWMAFQPIVQTTDGRLHAHEALLRTSEAGFPHPGALLGAAEELGALWDLGRAIRKSVAATIAKGSLPADVFVNLHPRDIADDELLDPRAPLTAYAARVVLEVTERASLHGVHDLRERVDRLRRLGYRIALDDLGAGYAGLTSFAALAPEVVKLDMSLVRGLDRDPVKQKIVASMAALCRDLRILVVAEGVETEEERLASREAGCDLIQGFLVGRPAPAPGEAR